MSQAPWLDVDLLVVGSGAAGLAAAVTAANEGLRVAVFEKEAQLGGTSAWSGGWMWLPGGLAGHDAEAERYLLNDLGAEAFARQSGKIGTYLSHGPQMVRYFSGLQEAALQFEEDDLTPDFHVRPGASAAGRMLRVAAFDGRRLGRDIERLRRPLPEFTVWGMGIESGRELNHFLNFLRSPASFVYVLRRGTGYLWDLLRYGRTMRLVNGNALVASLLNAALHLERGASKHHGDHPAGPASPAAQGREPTKSFRRIGFFTSHPVHRLLIDNCCVLGAVVRAPAGLREVRARHGVVLAAGGFPHDTERLRKFVAHAPTGYEHHSAAPVANTGDGLLLGEAAGGGVGPTLAAPAAWAPVSQMLRRNGSTATYPHFVDRAKPGVIAVDQTGRRFCDEAGSYHDVVAAWIAASPSNGPLQAWLICDRRFLWRYGLGIVKPYAPLALRARRTGYLVVGRTIEQLARKCGIESRGLLATLDAHNRAVPVDPAFNRGATPFDRSQGDPTTRPNPCVAPIQKAPFFAVRLSPGSLGTLAGLGTDVQGRVLDAHEQPIDGLYSCGNDMAAVMGGHYPSNGVTLGSAMIFGHLVGLGAAEKLRKCGA